jgi:hypothetical protein
LPFFECCDILEFTLGVLCHWTRKQLRKGRDSSFKSILRNATRQWCVSISRGKMKF